MVRFEGQLNEECKKFLKRQKFFAPVVSIAFSFTTTAPIIIVFALAVTKWIFLCLILLLAFFIYQYYYDRMGYPISIIVDQDYVKGIGEKQYQEYSTSIEKVVEVIDMGSWFRIKLDFKINMFLICQKDLLVEGTLEEFEEIFKDKLVVYEPKKKRNEE